MGTQTISGGGGCNGGGGGCHGGAGGGGGGGGTTQGQKSHALAHQGSSFYNLTLDEVQHQLGDLGKPINNMNLDELLKTVWSAEANQGMNNAVFMAAREGELGNDLRQKTVDEVWQDIQQGQNKGDSHSISQSQDQERQATLGEMTLEDFLVKAGVVAEAPPGGPKTPGPVLGEGEIAMSQEQAQWTQYELPSILRHPQQQQQQNMVPVFMPGHQVAHQSLPMAVDAAYPETSTVAMGGTLSDTVTAAARKRGASGEVLEKTAERRNKRMIKNRESAARSRARKQAYTDELENKVSRLEEENKRLRRQKEIEEKILPCIPPSAQTNKHQLRRTSSASF